MFKKILICFVVFTLMLSVLSCFDNSGSTKMPSPQKEDTKFDDKIIACLGDSITYTLAHGYTEYYPQAVERILGLYNSVNLGVAGSTVTNCTNRSPMCLRYTQIPNNADIITVMGGINDLYANIPLGTETDTDTSTFYGALNTIAKGIKDNYPKAYVVFCTVLPSVKYQDADDLNGANYSIVDMNNAIKTVATNHGFDVCDLYTLCGAFNEANYDTDGVHPTQAFLSSNLAPKLADFIKENYH
ncbi:MAG: SGNH/GDSL hydrolase family protein [Clostridia bacterium]|nr:SGNH/GDSL hydrolase family protein [Clostridia bacterium]